MYRTRCYFFVLNSVEDEVEDSEENEAFLIKESKEAVIADSLNKLNGGIQESQVRK